MKLTPAPGIIILAPLEETKTPYVITTKEATARILKGTVIAIGSTLMTDFGSQIDTPAKQHERWAFLSYEGNYDVFMVDSLKFYAVKFQDMRVRII